MSAIPVQNFYYIFCYAWSRFDIGRKAVRGAENSPDVLELLTKVLLSEVRTAIRRGLDRSYISRYEDLGAPKGRLIFAETVKRNLLNQMQVHCGFDELSHNVLHNQIIKTTLVNLSRTWNLDQSLRDSTKTTSYKLDDVDEIRLRPSHFRRLTFHRNNAHYDFLMKLCELISACLLPEEKGNGFFFSQVLNDPDVMGLVFEDFVRNFYRIEQNEYRVSRDRMRWDVSAANDEEDLTKLPVMETDTSLTSKDRKIVIETKFYKQTLKPGAWGSETKKVSSANLYQLFSYLKNMEQQPYPANKAEGVLLYPTVDDELDLNYQIQGHKLRVKTINLDQDWQDIRRDMFQILDLAS